MPLQIRATPPPFRPTVRASVQKNRPSFLSISFFFSSPSFTFVWSLVPFFLLNLPGAVQSHRRRRAASRTRRRKGGGERERETRENPLRNVFGPCAARYYLQSRAYIKYTCREEKGHDEKRERESFSERPRYENAHDDELRTEKRREIDFQILSI